MERIELLESKVAELEKLIATLISKEPVQIKKPSSPIQYVETAGYADIYQYKNSLILTSQSRDNGTYLIKESLKKIGAKWANVSNKDGVKYSGWMILGICKETDMDSAIETLVKQLADIKCTLSFTNKGKIEPALPTNPAITIE